MALRTGHDDVGHYNYICTFLPEVVCACFISHGDVMLSIGTLEREATEMLTKGIPTITINS